MSVQLLEPRVFTDERGFFFESYNRRKFREETGVDVEFVQDNYSRSKKNVLRGLHYQVDRPQGKLIRVVSGHIWDVAVDLSSGCWTAFNLSAKSKESLWIPPGFAHGFLVLSEEAEVYYKATDYYSPEGERTLLWNDPKLNICWPVEGEPIMSEKDRKGMPLE